MNQATKAYVSQLKVAELKQVLLGLSVPQSAPKKADLQARIYAYFGETSPNGKPTAGISTAIKAVSDPTLLKAAEALIEGIYLSTRSTRACTQRCSEQGMQRGPQLPAAGSTAVMRANSGLSHQLHVEHIPAGQHSDDGDRRGATRGARPINGKLMPARPSRNGGIIRCICDANVGREGGMIQCKAEGCGVWQHCDCIGYQEDALPAQHFCELCRSAWADPFWEIKNGRLISPAKLLGTGGAARRGAGGVLEPPQLADKTFNLTHVQMDYLRSSTDYQLQAVSLQLNDAVKFRFHWGKEVDLRVNGMQYRVYSRQPTGKISANVRDEPASLASSSFAGNNRIRLQIYDTRKFVLLLQLVKRRSLDEVKALMAIPDTIEEALLRVKKQVGLGEDDLAIGVSVISLRDPLSGQRMARPARFIGTGSLVGFDLDTFLMVAQRSRKWQCPHSMRHARVQDLQIDTYLSIVLDCLKDMPEVMEIEVSPTGEWRPRDGNYLWNQITNPMPVTLNQVIIKEEVKGNKGGIRGSSGIAEADNSEELSEGEELRQAAKAYATSSRHPQQEIIVLDDSDDEPPAKQYIVATTSGIMSPIRGYPQQNSRPHIDQEGVANGAGPGPSSVATAARQAISGAPSNAQHASRSPSDLMQARRQNTPISIRLPGRPPTTQYTNNLERTERTLQQHGPLQANARSVPGSGVGMPSQPAQSSTSIHPQQYRAAIPAIPQWSFSQHTRAGLAASSWHSQPRGVSSSARPAFGGLDATTASRPPLPASAPDRNPAESWTTGQAWTQSDRAMLGSLLQDDAMSPGPDSDGSGAIADASGQLPEVRHGAKSSAVIDLDSD